MDISKLPTEGVDIITHGSPCFLKGELVNTKNGMIPIEEIKVGDLVKSHDDTYNEVTATMKNETNNVYDIICSATHSISTTDNHPFLVYRNNKKQWIQAKDLTTKDFLCIPINRKQNEPQWEGTDLFYFNHTKHVNTLPLYDNRFWYLIGRFIGDGWVTHRKERNNNISGIKVCCAFDEIDELLEKIGDIFHYNVQKEKTVYKIHFCNKELGEFCAQFGLGAVNKHIPQHILDLKVEYLRYLMDGILESDGSCKNGLKYRVTTVSKQLAYNIGELALKTLLIPYSVRKDTRPKKHIIEGRIVNQRNTYTTYFTLGHTLKHIHFLDNDYLYSRVRKIKNREEAVPTYNLEVKDTHTYCVNNVAVHNCQDFSSAGLQAGGDIGSGTRSSLMWNSVAIINHVRPKYVVWENVKNVLSKKHIHNFEKYLKSLEDMGYKNYYQVLNAKDYGVPQNRERIYCVSIRNDITFQFPEKEQLDKMPIDYIEDNVDENFYLTEKNLQHYQRDFGCKGKEIDLHKPVPTLTASMGTGGGNVPYFKFPEKEPLYVTLKDILEDEVDEKFYLDEDRVAKIQNSSFMQEKKRIQEKEYCDTLLARDWKDPKCVRVGGIFDTDDNKHQAGSVYDKEGLAPALDTMQGGWRQPAIVEDKIKVVGNYMPSGHDASRVVDSNGIAPTVKENHGTVTAVVEDNKSFIEKKYENFIDKNGYLPEMFNPYNESEIKDIAPTQTTQCGNTASSATVLKVEKDKKIKYEEPLEREGWHRKAKEVLNTDGISTCISTQSNNLLQKVQVEENTEQQPRLRIRKLTPKECWRLMGFSDEDFEKAKAVPTSNSQLYKQAGNSIVVPVLEKIFRNLLLK